MLKVTCLDEGKDVAGYQSVTNRQLEAERELEDKLDAYLMAASYDEEPRIISKPATSRRGLEHRRKSQTPGHLRTGVRKKAA
jgi:hypothetical protein